MLRSKQDTYTLINGVKIPCMGYGTYKTESNEEGLQAIKTAIEVGYRHIDTAQGYKNEHLVGQAIKESGIPREDFLSQASYGTIIKAMHRHFKRLNKPVNSYKVTMWISS